MSLQSNRDIDIPNIEQNTMGNFDLNHCFNWFNTEFSNRIISASSAFLNTQLGFHMLALTKEPSFLWKGNDYFVTQIEIVKDCFAYVRLSNIAAQVILDNAFGKRQDIKGDLKFRDVTELEAEILTSYNEFLFKNLNEILLDKKEIKKIQASHDSDDDIEKLIHLTFYIHSDSLNKDEEAGKIIFSLPEYIVKISEPVSFPEIPIDIFKFLKSKTRVNIFVGKSKISLDEINNLSNEDIIILEKSNLHLMTIKTSEEITFNVNPDPRLVIDINNESGEQLMNKANVSKNIWDNLEVEISAEFEKIKMPLGDLKQITEGLVIDIASIIQNNIFLHIEGKKFAEGELVIVGDKYGVRITNVIQDIENNDHNEISHSQPLATQNNSETYQENDHNDYDQDEEDDFTAKDEEDSDFDYDDFEIEDDL